MPADTSDLLQKVYDLFSSIYASTASDQAFLAFETLGIPISDGMFKLDPSDPNGALLAPLAVERLSVIANEVPLIKNGSISRAMNTVDGTISLIIQASEPASANALTALGATKLDAGTKFGATLGSMDGVPDHRFHPVYASPTDWYVSSAAANWTPHSVGDQHTTGTMPPPTPPPAPPRNIILHPPVWRVVPQNMQYALRQPVAMQHPLLAVAAATPQSAPHPVIMARPMMMQAHLAGAAQSHISFDGDKAFAAAKPVVASPAILAGLPKAPIAVQPAHIVAAPLQLTQATAALNASTTPQQVVTNSIDISFDHCIVMLNRPWFPDTLLMLRNWYVPDYARGDISNNPAGGPTGLMPVLTTGFVAIRNLKISAQWSQQDLTNVQGSAGFGPFSLVGSSFDAKSGTLSCPGMQIVGWFCAALPVLPPVADPALPVSPTTTTSDTSGAAATATGGSTSGGSTQPASGSVAPSAGDGSSASGTAATGSGASTSGGSTQPASGSSAPSAGGGSSSSGTAATGSGASTSGGSTQPAGGSSDATAGGGSSSSGTAATGSGASTSGGSTPPVSASSGATAGGGSSASGTAATGTSASSASTPSASGSSDATAGGSGTGSATGAPPTSTSAPGT